MKKSILTSHPGILSNIAWVSIGNSISLVIGFTSSILLARWLEPGTRGVYALILTTSATLASILGINSWSQALAYFTGKKHYTPALIVGNSIKIISVFTILLITPLVFLPGHLTKSPIPELNQTHLWVIVLIVFSNLLFSMFTGLIMGLGRISLFASFNVTKAVVSLLLQLILLGVLGLGLYGAIWELVLSAFLVLCVTLAICVWFIGIDLRVHSGLLKNVLAYGGKSYPGHVGVMLLNRMDIYFVAMFGGTVAVGLYAVAKGLIEITAIIEQSISQAVTPKVIVGDFGSAIAIVSRAFRASFWINCFILLIGGLLAPWLIPFIYGKEYAGAVPAFLLLIPGFLFLSTRTLGTFFSMQIGRPEIPTYYILAFGLISLPVSYFLARQFGYLGAATAFSIVAILRGVVALILFIFFSHTKLKDVLLLNKADLVWLPQKIFSWFKTRNSKNQKVPL